MRFYLVTGQARLDGAFCEYTEEEKVNYLKFLNENGVANIEMECTAFASLTHRAGNKPFSVKGSFQYRPNNDSLIILCFIVICSFLKVTLVTMF